MQSRHEPLARVVEQHGTLAAHGLRDEEVAGDGQRGRMELVELEVAQHGARAQRRRNAVPGRHERIGRVRVQLAGSAASQDHGVGGEPTAVAKRVDELYSTHSAAIDDEVGDEAVLENDNAGLCNACGKRGLDGSPGRIAPGMEHASTRVRGLAPPCQLAVLAIEGDPEAEQLADAVRPLPAQDPGHARIGEAGPRPQGVRHVLCDAVIRKERRRDAALRVAGVALGEFGLRHECDIVRTARLDGGDQSGDARADDDDVAHG